MGIIGKIKMFLGITGVKLIFNVPVEFTVNEKGTGTIIGKLMVTSQQTQKIKSTRIKMDEIWRNNKSQKLIEMGAIDIPGFDIMAGGNTTIDFALPINYSVSANDKFGQTLGNISKFLDQERSVFSLSANASVEGAFLGTTVVQRMKKF